MDCSKGRKIGSSALSQNDFDVQEESPAPCSEEIRINTLKECSLTGTNCC